MTTRTKPSVALRLGGWCQGAGARDAEGNSVGPGTDRARSWCLLGILMRCGRLDAYGKVRMAIGDEMLQTWNDDELRTKDQVVAVLESVGE